jgi:hypothetical protein
MVTNGEMKINIYCSLLRGIQEWICRDLADLTAFVAFADQLSFRIAGVALWFRILGKRIVLPEWAAADMIAVRVMGPRQQVALM